MRIIPSFLSSLAPVVTEMMSSAFAKLENVVTVINVVIYSHFGFPFHLLQEWPPLALLDFVLFYYF